MAPSKVSGSSKFHRFFRERFVAVGIRGVTTTPLSKSKEMKQNQTWKEKMKNMETPTRKQENENPQNNKWLSGFKTGLLTAGIVTGIAVLAFPVLTATAGVVAATGWFFSRR